MESFKFEDITSKVEGQESKVEGQRTEDEGQEQTAFKEAFRLIGKSIWVVMKRCGRWVANHKLLTALVISVAFNVVMVVTHMNDAYGREHQEYEYIQLEEKYDSVRMADVKWRK